MLYMKTLAYSFVVDFVGVAIVVVVDVPAGRWVALRRHERKRSVRNKSRNLALFLFRAPA